MPENIMPDAAVGLATVNKGTFCSINPALRQTMNQTDRSDNGHLGLCEMRGPTRQKGLAEANRFFF